MVISLKFFIILTAFALSISNGFAKRFSNQYCEFELPPGWRCQLDGTEWVCQSLNDDRKKEAIIVLAAKVRGPQDSNEQYLEYLKKSKTFAIPGGKTQVSEPKYAKLTTVNGHRWVEGLHLASEVPGFYTRYMATVRSNLGVAVTFSVAKDQYDTYKDLFDKTIATLRVFSQIKANAGDFKLKGQEEDLFASRDKGWADSGRDLQVGVSGRQKKKKAMGSGSSLLPILLLVAVVGFFIYRKKSSKKKKKKSSSGSGGVPKFGEGGDSFGGDTSFGSGDSFGGDDSDDSSGS